MRSTFCFVEHNGAHLFAHTVDCERKGLRVGDDPERGLSSSNCPRVAPNQIKSSKAACKACTLYRRATRALAVGPEDASPQVSPETDHRACW